MNKKGEGIVNVIILIGLLFLLIIVGLGLAFGTMIIQWTSDEVLPELTNLGMAGSANMTSIGSSTLNPVGNIISQLSWFTGVLYILGIFGLVGLSVGFRITGSKWLAGFFIVCMLLLIITSIYISNIYEDFYNDGGDVGAGLHKQAILSWMIIYSPVIMCIIGFVCGIIMFTGDIGEETL